MAGRDYGLTGRDSEAAVARGLASAQWYHTDVPREEMKKLMRRSNGPALRDTAIWFILIVSSATGVVLTWGTWWIVPCLFVYGLMYSAWTDSRWHECAHGTAFKTMWMNDLIYQVSCFMIMREPTVWKWSHARHHTDTIIVGRDPEIVAMRPARLVAIFFSFFGILDVYHAFISMFRHATGKLTPDEADFIPASENGKVFNQARIWLLIYFAVIVLCIVLQSVIPLVLVPGGRLFGVWHAVVCGLTQHAGLAEDVLDHRLNARTVYINPISRFLYSNMNYHLEHHMFPMVPYHQLPRLHDLIKHDLPPPYSGFFEAYREIIPAVIRQMKDQNYFVRRNLPPTAKPFRPEFHELDSAPAE